METHREVAHTMGLPISLVLRGRYAGTARGRSAWADAMAELRWVDLTFSTWRDDSWVSRLARGEVHLEECPPEVAEVLTIGLDAEMASGGAFSCLLPGPDGERRLDPTGVVKGWAVDRAARHLACLDDTDWVLSAGGDLLAHAADDRPAWRVGVEDPADPGRLLAVVPVHRGAVATSGTAHRGAHLWDARTGRTAAGLRQVSVVASTATVADVDATAAFALGAEGADWLAGRGRYAVVVDADGAAEVVGGAVLARGA